jgi:hypothetical protein
MRSVAIIICIMLSCCWVNLEAQVRDFPGIRFTRADSIAETLRYHSLKNIDLLSHKLTDNLDTDVEKFRAIYTWVCDNISYDYNSFAVNKQQRSKLTDPKELAAWNKKIRVTIYKNLLKDRKTVCTGYAYLVKELAARAGINCVIVDGYGRNSQANVRGPGQPNHSWNAVRLNNKWYLCDPTWSSGAYDAQLNLFIKQYNDSYFLADPALFIRNHYPLDSSWTLTSYNITLEEFLKRPLAYNTIYKHNLNRVSPNTFDIEVKKGEAARFSLGNENGLQESRIELSIGRSGMVVAPTNVSQVSDGLYLFDYTFHTKGKQMMHVLVDGEYAYTYSVNVR